MCDSNSDVMRCFNAALVSSFDSDPKRSDEFFLRAEVELICVKVLEAQRKTSALSS